ncbi:MAG: homoserine dehydrogenase [Planctomycetota bacterium]|nr:homoserine dehydrogenase [Planctomycetota bacterium]
MAEPVTIGVGLIGSGVVGGGVAEVLLTRRDLIRQRAEVDLDLLLVADKERERALATGIAPDRITDDYRSVVSDPRISIVVELIGGVNLAYDVVSAALRAGKHVVTANKALLAERGGDLFALARTNNLCLSFEASVAGGIPLLLSLREGLIANRLSSLLGIVNGTCNYILSEMTAKGISFADSLKEAQNLGFAEADPSTDIDGKDSGHKLALLSALAFDTWIDFPSLHIEGIRNIQDSDIKITSFLGYTLKLLAVARTDPPPPPISQGINQELPGPGRLFLSVHPSLLRKSNPMASVSGSLNAVETNGDVVMESMFYGRGAGRYPTASAVVSDIAAIAKNLRYGGARGWFPPASNSYQIAPMEDYRTRYYLRFNVHDRSGVLGILATILGRHHVSIAAMHQFEDDPNDNLASVCLSTHLAREGDITQAIAEITRMDFLAGEPALIRIED